MVTFIKLEKSLAEALLSKESPINTHFENRGVQLWPNDPEPYIQKTAHPLGIELEDWTVEVFSLCGMLLADITEFFTVLFPFDDLSGTPQIAWQLQNIPIDFGWELVYLRITQAAGETFYTRPFQITAVEADKTARYDYREDEADQMESIRLQTYYRQTVNKDELTIYYESSTGNTVTLDYKASTPEVWWTEYFNNNMFVLFRDMLNSRYLYVNLRRANLFEAFEIPKLKASENFATADFLLSFSAEIYTFPPARGADYNAEDYNNDDYSTT